MILSKYEYFIYFSIYIVFLFTGIYNIYLLRDEISSKADYGFADGWSLIGRKRDVMNDEWEIFKNFIKSNIIWYIIHLVTSEICRYKNRQYVPAAHAIIGLAFLIATHNNYNIIFIFLVQIFSFYLISAFNKKIIIWALAFLWILLINRFNKDANLNEHSNYSEYYKAVVILSWGFVKCLCFCFDKIENKRKHSALYNFINYCGYTLYFPTFVFGPVMVFDRYIICKEKNSDCMPLTKRLNNLLRELVRVWWWLLFKDFILHFLYINYLEWDFQTIKKLTSWSFYAFGYLMGQIFHIHYVVTYGLAISIAKFDCLNPPNRPKCIGRISFYSEMWKNFDQGLYEFLFKYIYCGICNKNSPTYHKLFATVATFGFIYVWHGMFSYVLIWTVLNCFCLFMEKLFKSVTCSTIYVKFMEKYFSPRNQVRLYGLLASQIFIPSAFSNFYFFGGLQSGNYYMHRTYHDGFFSYISLTFCCYCMFQCSEMIWELEKNKTL